MDYEKKYKEALERAKSFELPEYKNIMASVFPELQESDDERIRKAIIKCLKWLRDEARWADIYGISFDSIFAWLEKQEGCEYIKKDWLEHIKQSWYKEGFINGKYSGRTSKEWTINDAATLKELIDFLENGTAKLQHDLTRYANWLKIQFTPIEKQGEQKEATCVSEIIDRLTPKEQEILFKELEMQKPTDKVEPKFHEGQWITNGDYTWKIVEVKPLDYILQSQDGHIVDDTISHVDAQFHSFTIQDAKDGDVLARNNDILSICIFSHFDGINNKFSSFLCHCGLEDEGLGQKLSINGYHDDSKNYVPATKEQRDLLFQKMKEAGYEWDVEKKELKKIGQNSIEPDDLIEESYQQQADDLIDMVTEKPAWSEEDEKIIKRIDSLLYSKCKIHESEYEEIHNWLKSLKDRVGCEVNCTTKQEWSKEDESILQGIWDEILANKHDAKEYEWKTYDKFLNWLKSLRPQNMWISVDEEVYIKEPVLAQKKDKSDQFKGYVVCCDHTLTPNVYERYMILGNIISQNRWKPSESDIRILEQVIDGKVNPINYHATLHGILEQLKKLREE